MSQREFFDEKYQQSPDPWSFATSAYELGRYERILAQLQLPMYRRAFEPGCSIGVLTEKLASRCTEIEAIDVSPLAVEMARQRCHSLHGVHIHEGTLPDDIPEGRFDLVVFSEIGYYFEASTLALMTRHLFDRLTPGGLFVAAHWLGESSDHVLSGDEVHLVLSGQRGTRRLVAERHTGFRIDTWTRL